MPEIIRSIIIMSTFTELFLSFLKTTVFCFLFPDAEEAGPRKAARKSKAQHAQNTGGVHILSGNQKAQGKQQDTQPGPAQQPRGQAPLSRRAESPGQQSAKETQRGTHIAQYG